MKKNLFDLFRNLKLFDKNLIIYFLFLSLLTVLYPQDITNTVLNIFVRLTLCIFFIFALNLINSRNLPLFSFLRYWYIVLAFPFLYFDVKSFIHVVYGQEFDPLIIAFDKMLFGVLPNIWIQKIVNPLLTEIMQISYGIYWITIPVGAAIFYFKRDYKHLEYLLHYITITFFLSYFVFIFFPVAGPRFYIADQLHVSYKGLFIGDFLRDFVSEAGFRGGAFPSSHVGVAIVILIFTRQFYPRIAYAVILPLVIALSISTVYGQYHYFTDILAGLIMGFVIGFWGSRHTSKIITRKTA